MDLGKWAYKALGNSSLFRESALWQEINPLVYSALFPANQPPDSENKVEERVKKEKESAEIDTPSFNQTEYDKATGGVTENIAAVNTDPLSQPIKEISDLTVAFDNTAIDYKVFFLE
jgi:hypothetical protein